MHNEIIQKEMEQIRALEKRETELAKRIAGMQQEMVQVREEIAKKEYALSFARRALGMDEPAEEEPSIEKRFYVYSDRICFDRNEPIKDFWFEGRRHVYESKLNMITTMIGILQKSHPDEFARFIGGDLSKYKGRGIKNLAYYITQEKPTEEDAGNWYEYGDGIWVKRNGLVTCNTMRVIWILLSVFSIDLKSFYITYKEDEPGLSGMDAEEGPDEDEYIEDDPAQLGFDLDTDESEKDGAGREENGNE